MRNYHQPVSSACGDPLLCQNPYRTLLWDGIRIVLRSRDNCKASYLGSPARAVQVGMIDRAEPVRGVGSISERRDLPSRKVQIWGGVAKNIE